MRLETIRDEAGGLQAAQELIGEEDRDPIHVDQVLEALGVSSVRERLEDPMVAAVNVLVTKDGGRAK